MCESRRVEGAEPMMLRRVCGDLEVEGRMSDGRRHGTRDGARKTSEVRAGQTERPYPDLAEYYDLVRKDPTVWDVIEDEIVDHCERLNLDCRIEFHHGGFSKTA